MKSNNNILKEIIKQAIRKQLREAAPVPPNPSNPNQPLMQMQPAQPTTPTPPVVPPVVPPVEPQPKVPDDPNVVRQGVVTHEQAAALIRGTKGKFFTAIFIKRSNGQRRTMNCRLGVKAYLRKGVLPYNPNDKGLIPCFDIQKRQYRMIPIDGLEEIKIDNYVFKVQK